MRLVVPIILAAAAMLAPSGAAAQRQSAQPAARSMDWLVGCWVARRGATHIDERWQVAGRDEWTGTSRTVRRDSVVEAETARIRWIGDTLVYAAMPSGQPAAEFRAVAPADLRDVTFANPAHDFPQRIRYRADGDSLHARIEGERDGRTRGVDYPFGRVACPP